MKKLLKKLGGILLAAVMVIGMYTPVAAANDGSITITNAIVGETYSIYKLADLESSSGDAYSYKVVEEWKSFLSNVGDGTNKYVTVTTDGYVKWNNGGTIETADFVAKAKAYAVDSSNSITATKSTEATGDTVNFTDLSYGWYLISSGQGALVMLGNANKTYKIADKNKKPEIEKKVDERPGQSNWGKVNDTNIGNEVSYMTTVKVHAGYTTGYVIYDKLSAGLTYKDKSIKIERRSKDSQTNTVETTSWTIDTSATNDYTFKITQGDSITLKEGDVITITYTAILNENAVIAGAGNPNETWLEYGNNPKFTTEKDKTITYTWDFSVYKYYTSNSKKTALSGATFKITMTEDPTAEGIEFVSIGTAEAPKYRKATSSDNASDKVKTITTNDTGTFSVEGLDGGIYYLYETDAPSGYNKLTAPVTFTISRNYSSTATEMSHSIMIDDETQAEKKIEVENQTGTKLPETGGIGTTIFYVLGGVLLLGGAILLVTRRRMQDDQSK